MRGLEASLSSEGDLGTLMEMLRGSPADVGVRGGLGCLLVCIGMYGSSSTDSKQMREPALVTLFIFHMVIEHSVAVSYQQC